MKTTIKWMSAGLLAALLSACGGGGGGGSDAGNNDASAHPSAAAPAVSFDTSSVSASAVEGAEPGSMTVTFTGSKLLEAAPYVQSSMTGQGLDPRISVSLGESSGVVSLRAASGLPPGTYTGNASIHVCVDAQCKQEYKGSPKTVGYSVTVLPHISSPVDAISMATSENGVPGTYVLTILPATGMVMDIAADDAASGWLKTEAVAGNVFKLTASSGILHTGLYQGSVKVTTRDGLQSLSVPVSMVVNTGMLVSPVHATTLNAATTEVDTHADLPVGSSPGVQFNWKASTTTSWIKLDKDAGKAGEQVSWHLDLAAIDALANRASHEGLVHLTPDADNVSPTDIRVLVRKKLPEVDVVAPYVVAANTATTVRLRGSGFNAIDDLIANVRVGGVAPTSVQRINDTALVLTMPPMPAGSHAVTVHKLATLKPLAQPFKAMAPTSFSYAAIPTDNLLGGYQGAVPIPLMALYEPVRQALTLQYATRSKTSYSYDGTALVQYRWNGSQWTLKTAMTPYAKNGLGLTADGNRLIAPGDGESSSSSTVFLFDIDTLSQVDQFTVPLQWIGAGFPLKVTNDNRVLTFDPYNQRSGFNYIDLKSKSVGSFQMATGQVLNSDWKYSLIAVDISADGEHVIYGGAYDSAASVPLMLDASEARLRLSVFQPFPQYSIPHLNRDGSRVFTYSQAFDSAGKLLGTWDVPTAVGASWLPVVTSISPDGLRLYALTYAASVTGTQSEPALTASSPKPRVYVFDLSKADEGGKFSVLGYFELNDYPGCRANLYNGGETCPGVVKMVVTPDQQTVFMAGVRNLVVAPIPTVLSKL